MKKLLYSLAVAVIALLVVNCSGNGGNTPAGIEKTVYTELQKGNYEKAAKLLVESLDSDKESTAEQKTEMIKAFTEKAKQSMEAKGGIKSFEVMEEKIASDGLSATVSTKVIYNDGTEKMEDSKYVKKDNTWKLSAGK